MLTRVLLMRLAQALVGSLHGSKGCARVQKLLQGSGNHPWYIPENAAIVQGSMPPVLYVPGQALQARLPGGSDSVHMA